MQRIAIAAALGLTALAAFGQERPNSSAPAFWISGRFLDPTGFNRLSEGSSKLEAVYDIHGDRSERKIFHSLPCRPDLSS